jgi:two-component system response regulator HydG
MSDKAFVLIVGEHAGSEEVAEALRKAGHFCNRVEDANAALASVRQRQPDVIVADLELTDGLNGLDVIGKSREAAQDLAGVLVAPADRLVELESESHEESGAGRVAVISLPIDLSKLGSAVDAAARRSFEARHQRLVRERMASAFTFGGLIGTSESLRKELKRLQKLAPTKSTILIVGESGTGKELIARGVHDLSPRREKPFKPINCAAVTESLLESLLCGHVKGAFTGAAADQKGAFESADGGTLFLDEIGDMPLTMQAKILRTLEYGEVLRVGSNEVRYVNVRIVAATHRDLLERIREGAFREDLFYRLHAQGAIRIPPLRERREDIPLLTHHFLERAAAEFESPVKGLTPESMRKLTNHSWRGNVRELKNVVERMVIETENVTLDVEDLPDHIRGSTDIVPAGGPSLAGLSMADVERLHILNTLKLTGGNRERAASLLKIGERTLYRKLKDYGET